MRKLTFFEQRVGGNRTLQRLLELRGEYRHSFGFALQCFPALLRLRLRLRAALDNSFPLEVRR